MAASWLEPDVRRHACLDGIGQMIRVALLAVTVACVAGAQTVEQRRGTIVGMVADTSLRALVGAEVSFVGSGVRVSTDSLGRFRVVNVPPGRFLMIARSIGYRPTTSPVDIASSDTLRLAFTLEPATVQELATVVVTERSLSARLQAFEERRKLGFGEFFTQADIEKINGLHVGDIVRRAKSVRLSADGTKAMSAREPANALKPPCFTSIYLDGVPLGNEPLNYLPSPKDIAAIEVYGGAATLPVWLPRGPLGTNVGCGAILVWTRDGSTG
jgi:hypothetical protein